MTPTQLQHLASPVNREPGHDAPLNPCELEIDLLCKGLRIAPGSEIEGKARPVLQRRSGLGSGLELILPGRIKDIWVNAPVAENFARASCYVIDAKSHTYFMRDERQGFVYPVRLPAQPGWYGRLTSRGARMDEIGILQGTYLAVYLPPTCGFWFHRPRLNCQFCVTGLNVGRTEAAEKSVEDVVEVARVAKKESGVSFIHFNSGFQSHHELEAAAPYVYAVKSKVGCLVGLQVMPASDFAQYDRLIDLGTDHFSFCFEFLDPGYFANYCPGKAKYVGQEAFFRALEYTTKKLGKGTCSGEIIAGIEPLENTLRAIDYITGLGAFPTVCIFRPVAGSDMERFLPPAYEEMMVVFHHVYEACRRNSIPIDRAPNIEVSLVVQPGDTLYLAPSRWSSAWYQQRLRLWKRAARPFFWLKARPRKLPLERRYAETSSKPGHEDSRSERLGKTG